MGGLARFLWCASDGVKLGVDREGIGLRSVSHRSTEKPSNKKGPERAIILLPAPHPTCARSQCPTPSPATPSPCEARMRRPLDCLMLVLVLASSVSACLCLCLCLCHLWQTPLSQTPDQREWARTSAGGVVREESLGGGSLHLPLVALHTVLSGLSSIAVSPRSIAVALSTTPGVLGRVCSAGDAGRDRGAVQMRVRGL